MERLHGALNTGCGQRRLLTKMVPELSPKQGLGFRQEKNEEKAFQADEEHRKISEARKSANT